MTLQDAQNSDGTEGWSTELAYSRLTDDEIHEKLIFEWLRFFRKNEKFKSYCNAKRSGNIEICERMESNNSKISALYEDWADIHVLPSVDQDSPAWKDWINEKGYLFGFNRVKLVDSPERGVVA